MHNQAKDLLLGRDKKKLSQTKKEKSAKRERARECKRKQALEENRI